MEALRGNVTNVPESRVLSQVSEVRTVKPSLSVRETSRALLGCAGFVGSAT